MSAKDDTIQMGQALVGHHALITADHRIYMVDPIYRMPDMDKKAGLSYRQLGAVTYETVKDAEFVTPDGKRLVTGLRFTYRLIGGGECVCNIFYDEDADAS